MKKIFFAIILLLLVLIFGTIVFQAFWTKNDVNTDEYSDFNTGDIPDGVNERKTKIIPTSAGIVEVVDVSTLPHATSPDEGFYHFHGSENDSSAPFSILYSELDNSFSIAIELEPIAENHELASQYFLELLEISEVDACKLNVFVGVPYSVNSKYQGRDLGLTYCAPSE